MVQQLARERFEVLHCAFMYGNENFVFVHLDLAVPVNAHAAPRYGARDIEVGGDINAVRNASRHQGVKTCQIGGVERGTIRRTFDQPVIIMVKAQCVIPGTGKACGEA